MRGLVSGTDSFALAAPTRDLYYATIEFYASIGFIEAKSWSKQEGNRDDAYCADAHAEAWLLAADDESDDTAVLKIRLIPSPSSSTDSNSTQDPRASKDDWRSFTGQLTLRSRRLGAVISQLDAMNVIFKGYPAHSPTELCLRDPLGTPIAITERHHALSSLTSSDRASLDARRLRKASDAAALKQAILDDPSPTTSTSPNGTTKQNGKRKRIGVMTSGGDSPGMNAAVRSVVRMSIALGCEAYAIYEGYEGLVQGGDLIKQMTWEDVRGWLSEGGTLIGTARCLAFRERKGRLLGAKHLILAGIDALVICGGDGSLTGADIFRAEWPSLVEELISTGVLTADQCAPYQHLTIVGLVGSIDNDMSSTDSTIGAYSSLHRICESVDSIGSTALSHSRAFVVEVMGRHCGWLALMAAVSTGADFVFIPERPPFEADWQDKMCASIKRHRKLGRRITIIIVAEGAIDRELNPITPDMIKNILVDQLHLDTRVTTLGHIQRGGTPCFYDRYLATMQGCEAVHAVLESTPETPSPMIGITENTFTRNPLMDAVKMTHAVAQNIEKKDFAAAMDLRDPEFSENYETYIHTSQVRLDDPAFTLPDHKRLRVAIIHVGAPAGGMNSATAAVARYCLNRGHTPLACHNGFPGLIRHGHEGGVQELKWMDVDGWTMRGGSELGTNRDTPDIDIGMAAYQFQKHNFDALIIIGGYEGFSALNQLAQARVNYPSFRIPMVCLPATISNNVPGTDYSLGSDTCLNALIAYCDATKQSASASRRRVFVVEVQGGRCGYVATMAGLTVGALAIYTPEEGISIDMLARDVAHLKHSYALDRGENRAGKLILRNERASDTYTTDLIARIIATEAKGRFESRSAVPGHIQQGGTPSPMDRVRATRLAIKCMQFIEKHACSTTIPALPDETSSVIGIRGISVVFTPVHGLVHDEADHKHRRPKDAWWKHVATTLGILSGRSLPPAIVDRSEAQHDRPLQP
ncbi:6-phosphofructokinase, alpha subunit [Savitreella phatthalungensis]